MYCVSTSPPSELSRSDGGEQPAYGTNMASCIMNVDYKMGFDINRVQEIARRLDIKLVEALIKDYTTLGVGGPAAILFPKTLERVAELVDELRKYEIPWRAIGQGSNLIVTDAPSTFVLISLKEFGKVATFRDNELEVSANYYMPRLVRIAMERRLAGLEELGGIPGSVGGMVRMNAGAYGTEMKDVVVSATLVNPRQGVRRVQASDLAFSYRRSSVARDELLLQATLRLHYDDPKAIAQRVRNDRKERKASQPLEEKSAGCIFKNPTDKEGTIVSAGKIIQDLGLKGTNVGGAFVSEKHGNFIVNRYGATSDDVFRLIDLVKTKVQRELGITLEEEVEIWK